MSYTPKEWGYAPLGVNGTPELYDLTNDPHVERNCIHDHARIAKRMRKCFIESLRENTVASEVIEYWEKVTNHK